MISSPRDIFDLWPKPRIETVSDDFKGAGHEISSTMVSKWAQRGRIPPEYWLPLIGIARARKIGGVTLDALARMHAAREREPAPAELRA